MDYRLLSLVIAEINYCVLLGIIFKKNSGKENMYIYSLHILSVILWTFGIIMYYFIQDASSVLFWVRLLYIAGGLIASTFLYFSYVFPAPQQSFSVVKRISIFIPNIILSVLFFFTPWIIKDIFIVQGQKLIFYGHLRILFDIHFSVIFLIAFWRFWKTYRTYKGIPQLRLKYVLVGTLIAVILSGTTNILLLWLNNYQWLWVGPSGSIIWLYCVVYAIIRYKLMDIRIAISRALIFIIVYIPFLVIPFAFTWWQKPMFEKYLGEYFWFAPAMAEGILAVFGMFIYRKIQRTAEQRIFEKEYIQAQKIQNISDDLAGFESVEKLAENVGERCKNDLGIGYTGMYILSQRESYELAYETDFEKGTHFRTLSHENVLVQHLKRTKEVFVYDESKESERDVTEVLRSLCGTIAVPCIHKNVLLGILVLGQKIEDQLYTKMEVVAFKLLANQISFAIMHTESAMKKFIAAQEDYQGKLLSAAEGMNKIRNLKKLMNFIVHHMTWSLDVTFAQVYLYDANRGKYVLQASRGENRRERKMDVFDKEDVLILTLLHEKRPILYSELKDWAQSANAADKKRARHEAQQLCADVLIPIFKDHNMTAFIILGEKESGESFKETDIKTFAIFANQAATSIDNAYQTEELMLDKKTLLYNYGYLQLRLVKEIEIMIKQTQTPLSILMVDIDDFKKYNDTYGHPEGDRLLKSLAGYFKESVRDKDMVFRYGGEEFTIILPNTDLSNAVVLAQRLCDRTKTYQGLNNITISIGVGYLSAYEEQEGLKEQTAEQLKEWLIAQSDKQLYKAKNTGKNRACYDEEMEQEIRARRTVTEKGKPRILVVEDEIKAIKAVMPLLNRLCDIEVAETAEAALRIFTHRRPQLVLLDLGLPDEDGRVVFEKMKRIDEGTPVIVASGHPDRREEMLALGVRDFFEKPVLLRELEKRIKELLKI